MRNAPIALPAGLFLLLATAGCSSGEDAPVAAAPSLPTAPEQFRAIDSQSILFRCDGGSEVAVMGDTARAVMGDGRSFTLSRAATPSTMVFAGEGLRFSVAGKGAMLVVPEGGRLDCIGSD
ncbi:MAG: MliC family protein [Pseudomonadota bacterium]|nr:MliC family protein [Pseudomonadota bacterium]